MVRARIAASGGGPAPEAATGGGAERGLARFTIVPFSPPELAFGGNPAVFHYLLRGRLSPQLIWHAHCLGLSDPRSCGRSEQGGGAVFPAATMVRGASLARGVGDMRYFAAFLGLGVALATAGLIQVLWLEFAYILDGIFLPHDDFADESSKNRQEASVAHPDTLISDGSGGFPVPVPIAPHTLQDVQRSQVRNPR